MFEKWKLNKKINQCKKTIAEIEKRRIRSQAALVEAILTNSVPNDEDVDYFNTFTAQINAVRDEMQNYQKQLDALKLR